MICELMTIFCRAARETGLTSVELPAWIIGRYVDAITIPATPSMVMLGKVIPGHDRVDPIQINGHYMCQGVKLVPS